MRNIVSTTALFLCLFLSFHRNFAQRSGKSFRDVTGVTSLSALCPYTDYCTSNATSKLEDESKTQCCGSCSCEDDCWERNTCCEDKLGVTTGIPLQTCEATGINIDQKQNWGYYVVTGCPADETLLAKKCSGEIKLSLEDSVWVTDIRTNKIYGNKHCALCHGVEENRQWRLATDCPEAMNGTNSPDEVIEAITNMCGLTVEPPPKEDHMDNFCLRPDITICNVTGQWKVYDQALETACLRFQQPYVHVQLFRTIIYRNIYCFLCNSPHQLVSDICSTLKDRDRTGSTAFLGLLDFNAIERKQEGGTQANPVCDVNEVRDSFQVISIDQFKKKYILPHLF